MKLQKGVLARVGRQKYFLPQAMNTGTKTETITKTRLENNYNDFIEMFAF